MGGEVTVHSRFNRIVAVVIVIAAALSVLTVLAAADGRYAWVHPAAALVLFFAWAVLWRPYVRVSDDGVTVQNVTHRVEIPWAALILVDTRFALTLRTPAGRFTAWSAPAPGALGSALAGRRPANRESRAASGPLRPGDLLGTESGDAALLVREAWQKRLADGTIETGIADEIPVMRRWDLPVLATAAVLFTAAVWTLAVSA